MADKTERLANLVAALLETRRGMTADEIRHVVVGYGGDDTSKATFRRAFERDKTTLRELGVPIVTEQRPWTDDPNDVAYRIPPEEYYLPDPGLEADELTAVRLLADTIRVEGLDPEGYLQKLGAASADAATRIRAELPFDAHAATVVEAIARHRRLRFRYNGVDRDVDPLHVHAARGRWHLQGHDHARDALRQFRLDRIEGTVEVGPDGSATVTDHPGRPTPHGRAWEYGDAEPIRARVLVDAAQASTAIAEAGSAAVVETRPDGAVVVGLDVRNVDGFVGFVLGFLDGAEVLEPIELRDAVVSWLADMAVR